MATDEAEKPPKVGLALSGGGFRAAFFHVGVLARLAETGVLPKVEVISTVSGGSIVGAAYYLLLKRRLETNPDGELSRHGYQEIVGDLEYRLRTAVQKNIRGRVFNNLWKNWVMALSPRYSRSDRIGDLYDRFLYKPAWGVERERKWRGLGPQRQIELSELLIEPHGQPDFDPKRDNWEREEKVPVLLINATSLNSGHNWRFEAICMGESLPEDPEHAEVVEEVDKNMRLERGYFADPEKLQDPDKWPVPEKQRDFPLGLAVAASAAVPGVFQPLAISKMYEGIRVQLVDGGVQDNQGVQGLFDNDCTHLVISDASGQMDDQPRPGAHLPAVLARSASIGRDRVRDEQLIDSFEWPYEDQALMHLRTGLPVDVVLPGTSFEDAEQEPDAAYDTSDFGVARTVQRALSKVRTDLDYFSDTEAFSLELDAYRMTAFEIEEGALAPLVADDAPEPDPAQWPFGGERLQQEIASGAGPTVRKLRAGKAKLFRFTRLRPLLAILVGLLLLAALGAAAIAWLDSIRELLREVLDESVPLWTALAALALAALLAAGYAKEPRWLPLKVATEIPLVVLRLIGALPLFVWSQLSVRAARHLYGS
ncbi:MAG TPA: patatin-like phospholipase family protein [Solirubrobacterales bacterium]|nr:patatin-like phospholipase family protein [Solirubrobacterales bacterium]